MLMSKKVKFIICLMLIVIFTVSCGILRRGPKDSPRDKDKKERYGGEKNLESFSEVQDCVEEEWNDEEHPEPCLKESIFQKYRNQRRKERWGEWDDLLSREEGDIINKIM